VVGIRSRRCRAEELGPTFVKLGQLLATRVDLFQPSWIAEFEKLHSDVPPVPFEALLPELMITLGTSPFDVRRSRYSRAWFRIDCAGSSCPIDGWRAGRAQDTSAGNPRERRSRSSPARTSGAHRRFGNAQARRYRPMEIAAEFARSLERELDFTIEAQHTERFAKNFADDPFIVIPKIYRQWTSETLLVQEHIVGIPGVDRAGVDAAGLDRRVLAARGAEALLRMILIDGFFHADPHPGNVFYLPGNRIVIIDFGMVGRLSPRRRREVIDLLAGLAQMEEEPMLDVLLDWAEDAYVDEARLAADINDLAFEYEGAALADIRIGVLIRRFAAIVRDHAIVLPADLTLMFKALMTMEGLGRQYDPDFRIVEQLQPMLRAALRDRYHPAELVRRSRGAIVDALNLIGSVPRDFARLLRDARRGRTRIELDLKRLDKFGNRLDATLDRATMGIMTASVVIGSSIVMTVPGGPTVFGVPVLLALGLCGYLMAFCNSIWIIYGIWRSNKQ